MIGPARPAVALALAAVLSSGAACGGGGDSDGAGDEAAATTTTSGITTTTRPAITDDLEQELVAEQTKRTPTLRVGGAACPNGAPTAEGSSVECVVEVEGVGVPYTVTLTALTTETSGGSSGSYEFKAAKPVVVTDEVVANISRELEKQGLRGLTVDCGAAKLQVLDVGATFECRVSDGRRLRVEVKDAQGGLSINQI
jgi:hypothetical protein